MKQLFLFLSTILSLIGLGQQTGLYTENITWTNDVGVQTRSTAVYVPNNYDASLSYSLVIGFYGQGDSPMNYIQNSKIMGFATDPFFGNVIIVVPDDGPQESWFLGDEDFGIVKAIKEQMSDNYSINQNEVFTQGFSFGGKSAFLHGLAEADYIKGIMAYSPAFYGDEDLYNNCIVSNCVAFHHDFEYSNANKVNVCTSSGKLYDGYGEGYMSPLAAGDQSGATWEDSFLGLAMVSANYINTVGGNAVFLESNNTGHSIAPLSVSKECWTFVNPISLASIEDEVGLNMEVYPNPATVTVKIKSSLLTISTLQIIDISGTVVYTNTNFNGLETIDVSFLSKGIYVIQINTESINLVEKVVIQ